MNPYRTPGIYDERWKEEPAREMRTAVPGFLGFYIKTLKEQPEEAEDLDATQKSISQNPSGRGPGRGIRGISTLSYTESPQSKQRMVHRESSLRRKDLSPLAPNRYTRWMQFEDMVVSIENSPVEEERGPDGQAQPADTSTEEDAKPKYEYSWGYTPYAVKGFFANGGDVCYVHLIELDEAFLTNSKVAEELESLVAGELEAFSVIGDVDLICVPDLMWWELLDAVKTSVNDPTQEPKKEPTQVAFEVVQRVQTTILRYCERQGDCFAILDSWRTVNDDEVLLQRQRLTSDNGALYYPWLKIVDGPDFGQGYVPPSGHVAGIFARCDEMAGGVHRAPANEPFSDVIDLERTISKEVQDGLNPEGINCIRAFPGRGIRVWGARTLSRNPDWVYINVRRIFLTATRWMDRYMAVHAFEPNTPDLWARVRRDLTYYCTRLLQAGALQGSTPEQAFRVKCDQETNPKEVVDAGQVVTEIHLAPTMPGEFIVVRIIQQASGSITMAPDL